MALWPHGIMVLLPRACLSRIPEYEFNSVSVIDYDSTCPILNTKVSFSEREFFLDQSFQKNLSKATEANIRETKRTLRTCASTESFLKLSNFDCK